LLFKGDRRELGDDKKGIDRNHVGAGGASNTEKQDQEGSDMLPLQKGAHRQHRNDCVKEAQIYIAQRGSEFNPCSICSK
jgi:hypothetical protein